MKSRKKIIKRSIFILLGVGFLFFATLVVHIGIMVYGKEPLAFSTTQIGRVDFNESINPEQAKKIESQVKEFKGVESTYFNIEDNILIYTFDNRYNTTKSIYEGFKKNSNLLSSLYTVSEKDLALGCPAMDNNSFYGKLTKLVSKIVN